MENFLNKIVDWNKFELLIDKNIFDKDIVLKAAYNFLDKWFFFFKLDSNWNIILVFTKREEIKEKSEEIIANFSDELIAVYLRDKLEKENKTIREAIVNKAINWPLDMNNFITLDTTNLNINQEKNQIDFDKDIDDILKEIENDPDLKIDEEEIEKILREIEEESKLFEIENKKPKINLDTNALKNVKKNFQDR